MLSKAFVWGAMFVAVASFAADSGERYVRYQEPEMFSYDELVTLYTEDKLSRELRGKLGDLTTTPFINNEAHYRGAKPHRPDIEQLGPSLRVVMWNIERGIRLDVVKLLFTDKEKFLKSIRTDGEPVDAAKLFEQIDTLQTADVLVLNELD
ncbi:MAG: hypothetical protein GY953_43415, partial [bacterium]|nr:hypothetical protein [bacterium]